MSNYEKSFQSRRATDGICTTEAVISYTTIGLPKEISQKLVLIWQRNLLKLCPQKKLQSLGKGY